MAVSLHTRIEELSRKLTQLKSRIQALEQENARLEEENAELQEENRRLDEELRHSRTDVEFLTMSHRLANNPDEIIRVRRRIDGMIRDIDRCISQLKE